MNELKTSEIRLGGYTTIILSHKNLLNGDDCYNWVRDHHKLVGWTYNYNPHCVLLDSFERLITCKGEAKNNIRIAHNVHIKCYIHKNTMLIGSFNLSFPTVQDMCYLVMDMKAVKYMKLQFNKQWNQLNK